MTRAIYPEESQTLGNKESVLPLQALAELSWDRGSPEGRL